MKRVLRINMKNLPMQKSKRVYISGPISGYDMAERRETFQRAATRFRRLGYDVVNPLELGIPDTASWGACMRVDIAALMSCHIIYLLPRWYESLGATIERNLAELVGIRVMRAPEQRECFE